MIWLVLLLGGCLIVDVSGQTTIISSLQSTNRMYVCPGEIVTYVCSGVGNQIRLSAPPYVPSDVPLLYVRGDTLGLGRLRDGPIVSNLISTDFTFDGSRLDSAKFFIAGVFCSLHCSVTFYRSCSPTQTFRY